MQGQSLWSGMRAIWSFLVWCLFELYVHTFMTHVGFITHNVNNICIEHLSIVSDVDNYDIKIC